mgnify:CR=1 FL=1
MKVEKYVVSQDCYTCKYLWHEFYGCPGDTVKCHEFIEDKQAIPMHPTYKGVVKWNGRHYLAGQIVFGSLMNKEENGSVYIYDNKQNYVDGIGDFTRYEWVEVEQETLKEVRVV